MGKGAIMYIIGDVSIKEGDAKSVVDAIGEEQINIEKWLTEMDSDNLDKVKDFLGKCLDRGNSDFVIKGISKYAPSIIALEAKHPP